MEFKKVINFLLSTKLLPLRETPSGELGYDLFNIKFILNILARLILAGANVFFMVGHYQQNLRSESLTTIVAVLLSVLSNLAGFVVDIPAIPIAVDNKYKCRLVGQESIGPAFWLVYSAIMLCLQFVPGIMVCIIGSPWTYSINPSLYTIAMLVMVLSGLLTVTNYGTLFIVIYVLLKTFCVDCKQLVCRKTGISYESYT